MVSVTCRKAELNEWVLLSAALSAQIPGCGVLAAKWRLLSNSRAVLIGFAVPAVYQAGHLLRKLRTQAVCLLRLSTGGYEQCATTTVGD